jgi:hypothetical protein
MTSFGARAGRYVPPSDWRAKIVEELWWSAQRLWCWREFSAPALVAGGLYETGHDDLALTVALVAVLTILLLLLLRPGRLVGALRRCRARSAQLSRQIAWPRVCIGLGWARPLERGSLLIPDLICWESTPSRVMVRLRPLPEHGAATWAPMADALRRVVGGASAEWQEAHGVMTVVVSRVGLPAILAWTGGLADQRRIVVGQRHGGTELALDPVRTPHLLLAGATGSGKGAAIRAALAGALEGGWQAVVIDPKESGEYHWARRHGVPVLCDIDEQVACLRLLEEIRRRRQAVIREHGKDSWRELPPQASQGWRALLVIIDEASDLLVPTKGKSARQRSQAEAQHDASALIAQLARKGRSAGIHLILAIQRPDISQLGDGGGALRNNLNARLALANLDADGIRMLGVSASDPIVGALDGTPGRGICIGFGDEPRPGACQVFWLDQQRAGEVQVACQQGLGAIRPMPEKAISESPLERAR